MIHARTGTLCLVVVFGLALPAARADDESEAATIAEVEAFLGALETAAASDDRPAVARLFDPTGTFEALERSGYLDGVPPVERARLGSSFTLSLPKRLALARVVAPFEDARVLRIRRPSSRRVEAYVRFRDAGGHALRMRWFLVRRGGGWRAADFEDIATGMRFTMLMGAAILSTLEGKTGFVSAAIALQNALTRLGKSDYSGAGDALDGVDTSGLPGVIEGIRQLLRAALLIEIDLPERALEALDEAEAHHPDAPVIHVRRAAALNVLGRHAEAIASVDRYDELLARDAASLRQRGLALAAIGDSRGALRAFEAGVADDPDDAQLVGLMLLALPAARKSEGVARVMAMRRLPSRFPEVADMVVAGGDVRTLAKVVDAFRAKYPDHLESWLYAGHLHRLEGDIPAAARAFRRAMEAEPDDDRRWRSLAPWLDTMVALDKAVPALAVVAPKNRVQAFDYLASALDERGDADALEALARAAQKAFDPAPLLVGYYALEADFLRGAYTAVVPRLEELADAAEARGDEAILLWQIEDRIVRSYVRSGDTDKALARATAMYERDGDPRYLAIAYAARGEHDMALRKIVEYLDADGGDPAEIFLDPELAEVTRHDPYLTVRAVHWPGR